MDEISEMKEIIEKLIEASFEYYQRNSSVMSDKRYDELYDRLALLENKTGVILSRSPTQNVGNEVASAFQKVAHKRPLLSLDKTKELEKLEAFLGNQKGILSWKLDGLTVVLNYEGGKLRQALTRGNGEIGEDITANVKCMKNVPLSINYNGGLSVRGEAVISFKEFERINSGLEGKYKNPRNLTSGTVRQLDSSETLKRNVAFLAFGASSDDDRDFVNNLEFGDSKLNIQKTLTRWGFDTVESVAVTGGDVSEAVKHFMEEIPRYDYPTDGLVLTFDSVSYGKSLGSTAKFPRDSIAFKWADDTAETTLLAVEWNTSRTGLINPVAIFGEVELEGTTVSRASLHNVSIVKELGLGIGDRITVYKANMIIPQIDENLTRSANLVIPEICPACGEKAEIRSPNGQEALFCASNECPAKNVSALEHFVSRDAMNIEGLSALTIEKLAAKGFLRGFTDFYKLGRHYEEIRDMEGFGDKSVSKLDSAILKSKKTTLHNFIYALGIKNVGLSNAKLLCRNFDYDINKIMNASRDDLLKINGFGEVIADSLVIYFGDNRNRRRILEMLEFLEFDNPKTETKESSLSGLTVVITGNLELFANRKELQEKIESLGGKAASTVTGKTDYLINNDVYSASSKNKKAKELGIPIISENDFAAKFLPQT